jgi:hypothetical protein
MFRAQSAHHQEVNDGPSWPDDERIALETCRGILFYVIYVNEQEICVSSW